MMRPVMISAAAITLGWTQHLYQAFILTFLMALGAVGIASLFAWVSPEIVSIPEQVLARTKPTYFDLVIALAAGSGGAFTMTHKESSAIPGVAMAVALLPPLASTGILLVFEENDLALKAFVLFFTNFAAMVLAGSLTFLYLGVSPQKARERSGRFIRNFLLGFFMLVFGVSIPLYFYSTEVWYDATYQANQSEELQEWLNENELVIDEVKVDEDRRVVFLGLLGPNPPLNVEALHTELENAEIEESGVDAKPFSIEVRWTQTARFSWPPELTKQSDERNLVQDYTRDLQMKRWYWIGTQYADGDWLRPEQKQSYTITVTGKSSFDLATNCVNGVGSYELSQENVNVKFEAAVEETCVSAKVDNRFITDFNHVINIRVDGEDMSLRLDSDTGVMHFTSVKPE